MMLGDDPYLPYAIAQMLPVILRQLGAHLGEGDEPALRFGLMPDIHRSRIVAGLALPRPVPIEVNAVARSAHSIAYMLCLSRAGRSPCRGSCVRRRPGRPSPPPTHIYDRNGEKFPKSVMIRPSWPRPKSSPSAPPSAASSSISPEKSRRS